jgi:NAD(P)-dependent dehydrogenase (short-subunit alcohol dehydrogenase family)/acyl carrier protein
MTINLSGTNFRSPLSPKKQSTTPHRPQSAPEKRRQSQPGQAPRALEPGFHPNSLEKTASDADGAKAPVQSRNAASIRQALSTVQQGLASIQALQAQTVQAHEKFLETQAEASRTLQQMIQSARQLTWAAWDNPPPITGALAPFEPKSPKRATMVPQPNPHIAPSAEKAVAAPLHHVADTISDPPANNSKTGANPKIEQILIDIVSQLTGYPEQMLGPGMDIESDLGIDSIKRVEILSALEEKMPHLPKVTPDMMGELKTLGQICDVLSNPPQADRSSSLPGSAAGAPTSGPDSGQSREIEQILIGVVSQLTGYPEQMLDPGMDIESDLGIDSIKRVEILSALEEKLPHLPKVTPDMMGGLKTLGQIISYLENPIQTDVAVSTNIHIVENPDKKATAVEQPEENQPEENQPQKNQPQENQIDRQLIRITPLGPSKGRTMIMPAGHFIGVAGQNRDLVVALIAALESNGFNARHLAYFKEIRPDLPMAGLILLAPMEAGIAFQWAKAAAPHLKSAAQRAGACFATVSALDGAFGFYGRGIADPGQGALAGLAKTAAIEWPGVHCRALDVDPGWHDAPAVARAICRELLSADPSPPQEIGIGPTGRVGLSLATVAPDHPEEIKLLPQDVVIVTGGARGVTAAAAGALVSHTPCTLVLMGRSQAPRPEPEWLASLTAEGEIKRAIMNHLSDKGTPTPKGVQASYRRWMANRQITQSLEALKRAGATAFYICADVRDADAVSEGLNHVRKTIGPVKGLIHGAGILNDRFLVDKDPEQFNQVFETKVMGLQALLKATRQDDLRYIVLFSSVSARMGNQGQVDYAMANEVLNKTAWQQASARPACKVISINWGPWDGGMVTPALRRNFLKNNVALIPIKAGARAMITEMAQPVNGEVEVVIGAPVPSGLDHMASGTPSAELDLTCQRDISLEHYPVLGSHQLDGRPVVPLALITEWLAHSALHANPGLVLHGLDDLRLLNGITLEKKRRMIQLLAGKAVRNGQMYEVPVEIRDGMHDGARRLHSSAKAILADGLPQAPKFLENGHFTPGGGPITPLDAIYADVLFHGKDLRGILEIIRLTTQSISARVASAPPPARWMNDPLRSRWIADPLILDSAFQMAIIWCHQQHGLVSLPSFAAAYRQYCHRFPEKGVSAVLEVQNSNGRKMVGNFTFLDLDKNVLARLTGYEAIMDPGLSKAFKAA